MSLGAVVVDVEANTGPFDRTVSGVDGSLRKAVLGSAVGNVIADGVSTIARGIVDVGKKILDVAVGGGFDRALNIQDARASLTGLGHDAGTVDTIMSNALDSVRGTAFGLDAAAQTAATAVAAGIAPGEELTQVLKTVADTATIAGVGVGEIGSIFNKVAAGGKVTTEVLNQLSDRGVPALQFLATELGVTSAEVSKMVSDGTIDFATFESAMRNGLGGAALESGNTARGALANVGAAVSRLGAMFAGPAVAGAPAVFQALAGAVDSLAVVLQPVATQFGEWLAPAMEEVAAWIGRLDFAALFSDIGSGAGPLSSIVALFSPFGPVIRALVPTLVSLGSVLGQVGTQVGTALAPVLPVLAEALLAVVSAVAPLVSVLAGALSAVLPTIAAALTTVVTAVTPLIPVIGDMLVSALDNLMPVVTALAEALLPVLAEVLSAVLEAVAPLAPPILDLVSAFLPLLPVIGELITSILPPLVELIMALLPAVIQVVDILVAVLVPAIQVVGDIITWLITNVITPLAAWFSETLGAAVGAFAEWFSAKWTELSAFWSAVWDAVRAKAMEVWNVIGPYVIAYVTLVKDTITNVMNVVSNVWSTVWGVISTVTSTVWGVISGVVSTVIGAVRDRISGTMSAVSGAWSAVWGAISGTVGGAVSGIRSTVEGMVSFFSGLPGRVGSAFSSIGSAILNAFKSAFNGVARAWNNSVGRISVNIPDWVPNIGGNSYSVPRIPYAQRGAYLTGMGSILVGENGPEILNLPRGASVVPWRQSDGGISDIVSKMAALTGVAPAALGGLGGRAGLGGDTTVHVGGITITVAGADIETAKAVGAAAAAELVDHLTAAVRVR